MYEKWIIHKAFGALSKKTLPNYEVNNISCPCFFFVCSGQFLFAKNEDLLEHEKCSGKGGIAGNRAKNRF